MSELAQFKLYVQMELEDRISEMDDLGFDDEPEEPVGAQTASGKMNKFLMQLERQKNAEEKLKERRATGQTIDIAGKKLSKRIKIAQITFAFFNGEVINLLRKRGLFIQKEQWKKLNDMNKTITEKIQDKDILDKL